MTGLTAAHRGYEYQDLLVAGRLVDVILGTLTEAHVDRKLVDDDRFDDLTVRDAHGLWQRTQFKHSSGGSKPLTTATFTQDGRDLRLDRLVAAAKAFRDGPGAGAPVEMRIVMRDALPVESALATALAPSDAEAFIGGVTSTRWRFNPDALWPAEPSEAGERFAFLREDGPKRVEREDLVLRVPITVATCDDRSPWR